MEVEELRTDNFKAWEFRCKCGVCKQEEPHQMQPELLEKLQLLRDTYKKPMNLTSAFRCYQHPVEAAKIRKGKSTGQHNKGTAVDIYVDNGASAFAIQKIAFGLGFTAVVYNAKLNFVHIDVRKSVPVVWNY